MFATQSSTPTAPSPGHFEQSTPCVRKRKAEHQDGERERLSKRLSLLKLEQQGSKSCAPNADRPHQSDDEPMQLDDSKHRVFIHNMDDELSSDSEGEDGRLVFLRGMEKHLRQPHSHSRIPPRVLANDDGELAGMQLVLYNEPKSLSVPEEEDGVRKAIIETRHRLREKQRLEQGQGQQGQGQNSSRTCANDAMPAMDVEGGDDAMEID